MRHSILAAALLGALAALPAEAQQRQRFQYWYGLTGQLGDVMEAHCKRFNDSQTRYEAVCVGQGGYDRAEQNTIAAYRARQHPTIVQIYDAGTVNFMLSGAIVPANKFAEDFGVAVNWADYFPGISRYYATSKGEMWSFPYNSSSAVMYWNRAEWAKIGKTEAPKTWEAFEADLRALKAAGHQCGFAFDFDTWQALEQASAIHNEPIATQNNGYDGLGAEVSFNRGFFPAHMRLYKRWLDEGLARIQTAQVGRTIVQAFADGSCASTLTSIANHGVIRDTAAPGLNWHVAMIPTYEGRPRFNSLVGGASLWVMAGKSREEYEAAAAFFNFIIKPEEEEWMATVTGYIPVTNAGYRRMVERGFYRDPKFAGREIAIESLTASEPTPITRGIRLGNFTSIRAEVRSELEAAFTGQKELQVALDAAATRSNQILRRFEQTFRGRELP
jgi:sn-glycerol 3-phosphate transport system substrate-binding protein